MESPEEKLREYAGKRDFRRTPEPAGGGKRPGAQPIFIIQKHWAVTLHYDFRLEIGGVLVSWAVPKGPSTDPHLRRQAIPAEDHPLEYAEFEGVIPQGEYGAGIVMVWDTGAYENITGGENPVGMEEALAAGHVAVRLHGKKLRGGYALIRAGGRWLLLKMHDAYADASFDIILEQPDSALTGRNLQEIAEDEVVRRAA
jgi:DNA ligase D-like protein (predicted 3'-phosphoesterase)